jgi:hypothetical protein
MRVSHDAGQTFGPVINLGTNGTITTTTTNGGNVTANTTTNNAASTSSANFIDTFLDIMVEAAFRPADKG